MLLGGKVTSAVSGKTDVLVVGKDPGCGKVTQARSRGITLMSLLELQNVIRGTAIEDVTPMAAITSFSSGYTYRNGEQNSLALIASPEQLAFAAGIIPSAGRIMESGAEVSKSKKRKGSEKEVKKEKEEPVPKKQKMSTKQIKSQVDLNSSTVVVLVEPAPTKSRGRPKKVVNKIPEIIEAKETPETDVIEAKETPETDAPKKRGRPRSRA